MEWIIANLGSIIVFILVVLILSLIIRRMIKDKAAGRSSCGCNCGQCPMAGKCHSNEKKPSGSAS